MKNQFNKLTQGIYEAFNGPRTKDTEYDKIVQEYQLTKERLLNLKSLIENYPKRLEGYKATIQGLISNFETIFEGDKSMYSKFITDAQKAHKALDEKLNNMFLRIDKLKETTDKWLEYCATVEEKMKLRDDKRKTYDHYDEKMGDLSKDRQKIIAKGNVPDEKEEEKYERNIQKYKDAAKEYIETTNDAYKFMCYFIDSKYENVSIGLAEFLDIELIFYYEAYQIFIYFKNIKRNVLSIKQSFKPPIRNYDASNYIRGKELLNSNIETISGVIKGNPAYSRKNTNDNEMQRNNTYSNPPSFMNNKNPYKNINQTSNPFDTNNNIDNSIPDPFGNNNNNFNNNPPLSKNFSGNINQTSNPLGSYRNNIDNSIPDPFGNNNNNFGNNPPSLKNPYKNINQTSNLFNSNSNNIDNSIPDPFGNNVENDSKINPFVKQNSQPVQSINPYNSRNSFSGDNPFNKPNV